MENRTEANEDEGPEPVVPLTGAHMALLLLDAARREVEAGVPQGRERALALTKLDECAMWLQRCAAAGAGR